MLNKALLQARSGLFDKTVMRSFLTYADKNYKTPESLDELVKYLDKRRPTFTLLYFTASWNPVIPKIEKDYEKLASEFKNFEHFRVDCDKTPLVKQYFDARVEPQFLILLNGGELRRTIGYNFGKIGGYLNEASELHYRDFTYFGGDDVKNQWERFYDNYDRFARSGEYDRDSMRLVYEPINDQHRGVGTIDP